MAAVANRNWKELDGRIWDKLESMYHIDRVVDVVVYDSFQGFDDSLEYFDVRFVLYNDADDEAFSFLGEAAIDGNGVVELSNITAVR
jgi:hypothetical protein